MGLQRVGHAWGTFTFQVCHSFSSKEQVSFNFMAALTICSDFGAQENKICQLPTFLHLFAMKWWDQMPWSYLVFWMLSIKLAFSLSSFTFIKRLFSSPSLSSIKVVSPAYLRLLIFLLEILIPAYDSSTPEFLMMYSAYKLNKQGDSVQAWCAPFPVVNQLVVPYMLSCFSCVWLFVTLWTIAH